MIKLYSEQEYKLVSQIRLPQNHEIENQFKKREIIYSEENWKI